MSRQNIMVNLSIIASICFFTQSHAAEENTGTLHTNPFSNPYISEMDKAGTQRKTDFPANALELRGTMVAGANSQANIGGKIIAIDEEIEGYKLVSVKQRYVVLDKNGTQKTLSLDPDDVGARE